jgi:hypothetical protein
VTRPGSAMARFLGSATSTLAADHELIPFAQLQVDN